MLKTTSNDYGLLLVLLAAVLWGTTGTAQALSPPGFSPLVIGALRLVMGGSALLLWASLRKGLGGLRDWPVGLTLSTAFFTAAYQALFFSGIAKTGVAAGTIVAIGSAPVAAGIMELLFYERRPTLKWLTATALAVGGGALLILSGGDDVRVDPAGILLSIGSGISYAAYTLGIKSLLREKDPDSVMAVVFSLGGLILAPFLFGLDLQWISQPRSIAVILHLGLVATAMAYWLFARGLQRVEATTAVTVSLAEPLTAAILGIVVLGEQLNLLSGIGIGLIFCGLALLTLPFRFSAGTDRGQPAG